MAMPSGIVQLQSIDGHKDINKHNKGLGIAIYNNNVINRQKMTYKSLS